MKKLHPFSPCFSTLRIRKTLVFGSFYALATLPSMAQTAPSGGPAPTNLLLQQTEQMRAAQRDPRAKPAAEEGETAPETYPGESADLGPQMLLKKKKRPTLFEASTDTSLLWTSNALSSPWGTSRDTTILQETATLALAPEPFDLGPGKLSLRTGYTHMFSIYDLRNSAEPGGNQPPLNSFNIQLSSVSFTARYNFFEKWNASLGVEYNRVMGNGAVDRRWRAQRLVGPMSFWRESYVELTPRWSLDRMFSLAEKVVLTLGYSGAYHFSETDGVFASRNGQFRGNALDRLDSTATVGLMFAPSEKFFVNANLRFNHGLFTRSISEQDIGEKRRTTSLSPTVNFTWSPKPWVSARIGFSAEFFRSNDPDQNSYNKVDFSSGLNLMLRF